MSQKFEIGKILWNIPPEYSCHDSTNPLKRKIVGITKTEKIGKLPWRHYLDSFIGVCYSVTPEDSVIGQDGIDCSSGNYFSSKKLEEEEIKKRVKLNIEEEIKKARSILKHYNQS